VKYRRQNIEQGREASKRKVQFFHTKRENNIPEDASHLGRGSSSNAVEPKYGSNSTCDVGNVFFEVRRAYVIFCADDIGS